MTYQLDIHVSTVDANVIHKVDTGNPAHLHNMWTAKFWLSIRWGYPLGGPGWYLTIDADQPVLSKCADSVEQGRRLENLSWRLWQRETFVVDNEEKTPPTTQRLPENIPSESRISDLPKLSGSVESLVDEEVVDSPPVPAQLEIARPRVRRQDSCASTRSKRERHISSDDFEKMIVSIVKDKGPLVPPALKRSGSDTAESQSPAKSITASGISLEPSSQSLPRTTVVRGFWPSQIPTPQTIPGAAPSSDAIPEPESSPVSSEEDQSLSNSKLKIDDEAAVDSDTDDFINESAIDDDDDSSDWEDTMEESGKSSMDDKVLQRVDSKTNLTSRRSLITLMLAQNDRPRRLGNHVSQSTSAIPRSHKTNDPALGASPNDADEAPPIMKGMRGPGLKPIHEVPRSSAQPIMTGPKHIQPQAALSPRTTRRNMLATELTESLRRHLLWERQQKSSTANAVLKRRHTSQDVANLKQYPEKPCMKKSEDVNASSWNQYFSKEASDGYHSKGW
ncbi:hypothetical protein FOFC_15850 [Fusarium oxysporum]|nr:hypothetical protein FOFC_15850 [Fusarium oxysporum]